MRAERAKLLGFATYADYRLDDQMAKTPQAARKLLDEVWGRARAKAAAERDALQAMIAEEGGNFALAPHDWRYYAEKLRKARYDLDEAEIKPYFQLDKMIEAAFETARRLFGLTFTPVERAALSPGRARLRGDGRRKAATSACSSATISRAAPSTAAPG